MSQDDKEFMGERTVIENPHGSERVCNFRVYTRVGMSLFRRPEHTEEDNLFIDPSPLPVGTKVYVEHPCSAGFWELIVVEAGKRAESGSMLACLEFDETIEFSKCWIGSSFCSKKALERIRITS